jgi:PIN domain nuclease of toxin-antitoxin system
VASAEPPASALDASAVLALLNDEDGSEVVAAAIADGAAISVVNLAEVLSKVAERGGDPAAAVSELRRAEGSKRALTIEPLTAADCIALARLRPITKRQGLSLADRACLALSERLGVPALTTDEAWEDVPDLDVEVRLIR